MKKILHVVASPRGDESYSNKLANELISQLQAANPGSEVQVKNLARETYAHLQEAHATAFVTAPEKQTPELAEIASRSTEAVAELQATDILVISTPMYNFGVPSSLKAWIDHISRSGLSFRFSEKGPEGLITGKKVYIVIASGSVFSEGVIKGLDFIEPYLKGVLSFMGMKDITVLRVEGLGIPGLQETALEKGIAQISI